MWMFFSSYLWHEPVDLGATFSTIRHKKPNLFFDVQIASRVVLNVYKYTVCALHTCPIFQEALQFHYGVLFHIWTCRKCYWFVSVWTPVVPETFHKSCEVSSWESLSPWDPLCQIGPKPWTIKLNNLISFLLALSVFTHWVNRNNCST